MKTSLSLRTLLRTPLKTLLTLLLLAATSYMMFISVAEYAVTARERERVTGMYQGVGAVEAEAIKTFTPVYSWSKGDFDSFSINITPFAYSTDFYLYTDDRVTPNLYGDEAAQ